MNIKKNKLEYIMLIGKDKKQETGKGEKSHRIVQKGKEDSRK